LKEGAGADALANSGVTTLWLATEEGRVDVMKLLLKKDANANNAQSDNILVLMTALICRHTKAVRLLLENSADVHFEDGEGVTPLMNATKSSTMSVLKGARGEQVREGGQGKKGGEYIDLVSKTGFTVLIIAEHPRSCQHD
jgi:hypothetical protein